MKKSILLLMVISLLALTSGCRVFPGYRGCDSFRDCLRSTVRAPADWCWGNCPTVEQAPPDVHIDGVQSLGGK